MNDNHLLCWNVHGLNSRARRNVIRTVVTQQRASVVCVQESKIENFYVSMNLEITGFDFDYISLPAIGIAGGAVTSWRRDIWAASNQSMHRFFYHGAPYPPVRPRRSLAAQRQPLDARHLRGSNCSRAG
jgi:hypothetical protein